ncbi:MAG: hypothetical protein JO235_10875, partial [Chroococcidiopsidaceae cyanobacterium CP_BM_RX_35]|nr:hypothetical protein [Chroococcidiopsidaceae cyanobacterium CP_BM_RX_35]
MQVTHDHSVEKFQQHQQNIAISATFTAEPIEESLAIWMQELNIPSAIQFAPYNQIFQQLLDPSSLLSQNQHGINIVLLRFEDWRRTEDGSYTEVISPEEMERNVQELVMALKSAASRSASLQIVCFCPASPAARADASLMTFFQQMQDLMELELSNVSGLHLLSSQDLNKYPVEDYYDLQGDRIGHIPFTPLFFTALGTALARKIYGLKSKPSKVIVLDCDNTLWKG